MSSAVNLTVSIQTKEDVRFPVSATKNGVPVNPTTGAVEIAFPASCVAPVTGDWKTGFWEIDESTDPDTYYAVILVGTGGTFVPAAAGLYDAWVRFTIGTEKPVRKVGQLNVTA
jgi:hypothetical protein